MKLSDRGLLEICEHEGIVPAPYLDSTGVWTYGVGHTQAAGGVDPRSMPRGMPANLDGAIDEALRVFREDVAKYEARVNKAFPVPLTQHQFDALVSWDFNTGGATWRAPKSGKPCKLVQEVNAGDFSGNGFFGWLRPPEVKKRRTAEARLFQTGDYDANGDQIAIWNVDAAGRIRGRHSVISGAEILKRMGRTPVVHADPADAAGGIGALIAQVIAAIAALFERKPKQ